MLGGLGGLGVRARVDLDVVRELMLVDEYFAVQVGGDWEG